MRSRDPFYVGIDVPTLVIGRLLSQRARATCTRQKNQCRPGFSRVARELAGRRAHEKPGASCPIESGFPPRALNESGVFDQRLEGGVKIFVGFLVGFRLKPLVLLGLRPVERGFNRS